MSLFSAAVTQTRGRKYGVALAALLMMALMTLLYFDSSVIRPRGQSGSDFIYKGPGAENKAVVLAHMMYEDVSWVAEELPEYVSSSTEICSSTHTVQLAACNIQHG